jgi:hypothetical protein
VENEARVGRHKTGQAGAKVVVIWVPGEEGRRVASRWKPVE